MDSLDELREWSGRDIETLQKVKKLKKHLNENDGEVVLDEDEIYTADKLADYFVLHRNLKYLEEMAVIENAGQRINAF